MASRKYNTVGAHQNHLQVYAAAAAATGGGGENPLELTCLPSSHNTVIVLQTRGTSFFLLLLHEKAIWLEASGDSQVTGHRAHARSVVPSQMLITLFTMTLLAYSVGEEGRSTAMS